MFFNGIKGRSLVKYTKFSQLVESMFKFMLDNVWNKITSGGRNLKKKKTKWNLLDKELGENLLLILNVMNLRGYSYVCEFNEHWKLVGHIIYYLGFDWLV